MTFSFDLSLFLYPVELRKLVCFLFSEGCGIDRGWFPAFGVMTCRAIFLRLAMAVVIRLIPVVASYAFSRRIQPAVIERGQLNGFFRGVCGGVEQHAQTYHKQQLFHDLRF
jgi:hypothetical protein